MGYKHTINRYLHNIFARRVRKAYIKKVGKIFKDNPQLAKPVDEEITKRHIALYSRLRLPCNDLWLRLYTNLSGIADYRYLPEDLYYSLIERVLCDCDRNGGESEDKNLLSKIIPSEFQPRTFLRYIRGLFFDADYNFLTEDEVCRLLHNDNGDLIGKIAHDSMGGFGVKSFSFKDGSYQSSDGKKLTSEFIKKAGDSYILQEKLCQCKFSALFNPSSLNTCRMITLRCPWNGEIVVCKSAMRIGRSGGFVDNLSSGGVALAINDNGRLSEYAVQFEGMKKFYSHPDSGVSFKGQIHPYYRQMCEVITSLAHRLPHFNLVSWDVIATDKGEIKIIEINLCSQGTNILQFDFGSFFGEYTEQVIDWVAAHKGLDNSRHLKPF